MKSAVAAIVALSSILSLTASGQTPRPYIYRQVAVGGSGSGNGLSFLSPLMNNNGTVAFYATKAGVGNGILTGQDFTANAIFNDQTVGPYSGISSPFALNDSGTVAVKATVRATNQGGIFVGDDTAHNLVEGWGVIGSAPLTLTNNGTVAIGAGYGLYTYNPSRNHDIFLRGQQGVSGSVRVAENTFTGPVGTFRRLEPGTYTLNEAGQDVFMAQAWDQQPNGYIEGIYQNNSTSSAIVDATGRFFDNDGWLDINNAGTLAFTASTDDNLFVDSVFRGRGENAERVASIGADYSSLNWVDINDAGTIAFNAQIQGTPGRGVFTGPSKVTDKVVGPGDQLFGKTVRDAYFRRGGLNNVGAVAFEFVSTDLYDIIAVATPAAFGDADLNGVVDFDDYAHIDNGFNNHLAGWVNGDFDGNGQIDFDDYALIDAEYNRQHGGAGTRAIPEPSTMAIMMLASLAGLKRR